MQPSANDSLWPSDRIALTPAEQRRIVERIEPVFKERLRTMQIDESLLHALEKIYVPLAAWAAQKKTDQPLVLGINGAQGSGKSTTFELLKLILGKAFGLRVEGFSIDDLYKTRAEREELARTVHPLLITRGVPGTHDTELGLRTLDTLKTLSKDRSAALPAFDKAVDDRKPKQEWPRCRGPVDIIILEGWCVGACPQPEEALAQPVNALEAEEDPDGTWRRYVNGQLAGDYERLFAELDALIMLKVPSMESVFEWRSLQERKLAEARRQEPGENLRLMDDRALERFIMHYERLTRYMLEEMPGRADVTLFLNEQHQIHQIRLRS